MGDTRMTVKEMIEKLQECDPESVVIVCYNGRYWPFYRCYQITEWKEGNKEVVVEHLNNYLGEKLTTDNEFTLLK